MKRSGNTYTRVLTVQVPVYRANPSLLDYERAILTDAIREAGRSKGAVAAWLRVNRCRVQDMLNRTEIRIDTVSVPKPRTKRKGANAK